MKRTVFAIVLGAILVAPILAEPATAAQEPRAAQAASSAANAGSGPVSVPPPTVKVSQLPPLSISKDWTDQAYWAFTLFLAVVGGFQAWLLWGNLRAIERQAVQMERQTGILQQSVALAEKSAETAKQNIELFVNRERAHLRVEPLPLETPLRAGPARVSYRVMLHGNSDAYITGSCARVEITDSSEPTDDAHWFPAMNIPQVITPDQRVIEAQVQGVFPRPALEPADVEAIEAGRKFIHFRGFVKYNDVFGAERWTRFRKVWALSQVAAADGTHQGHWTRHGNPKDNSET